MVPIPRLPLLRLPIHPPPRDRHRRAARGVLVLLAITGGGTSVYPAPAALPRYMVLVRRCRGEDGERVEAREVDRLAVRAQERLGGRALLLLLVLSVLLLLLIQSLLHHFLHFLLLLQVGFPILWIRSRIERRWRGVHERGVRFPA
ncbi:hypothetical protein C8J57DRAFT_1314790 [Mycena rebaudengoi]|nr:hypothetical protein C8J57DRAFT_1314790 [Mycena rebaudengoi]